MTLEEILQFYLREVEFVKNELVFANSELKRAQKKLSNKGFVDNAPKDVVQVERDKVSLYHDSIEVNELSLADCSKRVDELYRLIIIRDDISNLKMGVSQLNKRLELFTNE